MKCLLKLGCAVTVAALIWPVMSVAQTDVEVIESVEPDSLLTESIPPELEGAVASMAEGDFAAAAVELGSLVVQDTANVPAMRLLASAYARLEAYSQAAQVASRVAALDSADAGVRLALGYYHQKQGDVQLAEMYYSQAVELDPGLIQGYQGLGWIYLQRQELERALSMVTRTTERAPDYAPNYLLMGRALTAQGFYENAMRAYERAFVLRPDLRERYGILLQELAIRHEIGR